MYVKVLLDELGFTKDLVSVGNDTYSPTNINKCDLIIKHVSYCQQMFNINVTTDNEKLPGFYWLPKLHKNPFKFRFIAGASKCSTKQASVVLNFALKHILHAFKKYCNAIHNNTGINCFWSINSSLDFLRIINNVNVYNLQVFDFSTLYTNLDLKHVSEAIFSVIDIIFKGTDNYKFLCVNQFKQFFASKQYKNYSCFSPAKLKHLIEFVLDNTFVCFAGLIYKQIRGVPMGGNSSPLLADIFLCYREYKFMMNILKEKKLGLAKLLSNTVRYVDDICVINYTNFDKLVPQIYPIELIAEREGTNNKHIVYLDIELQIQEKEVVTKVYHKVDSFNFDVIMYCFPSSNIDYKVGLNVFASQIIRYVNISSKTEYFITRYNNLLEKLLNRGYNKRQLLRRALFVLLKHNDRFNKFGHFKFTFFQSLLHCKS